MSSVRQAGRGRWRSRIRRVALGAGVLLLLVVLGGAAYETAARGRAVRTFAPPGTMVDVGGRRIQLDCRGAGSPTVVLEAGLDLYGSLSWASVHDSLARTTRTCAYSRAGMMWSDPAPGAFDSRRAARDLHTALQRAGERPPWVLAGHSMGGPYVMTFTARYPAETAGLVMVDASHPDQEARMREAMGIAPSRLHRARDAAMFAVGPALARLGLGRWVPLPPTPASWTPAMQGAHAAFFPTSGVALMKEVRGMEATLATAGRLRRLGDRPVVVLTAVGRRPPGVSEAQRARQVAAWNRMQADQAAWSTRGRQEIVDASHYLHHDRLDLVVGAVREVVAAVRRPARTRRDPSTVLPAHP
jgi:pimeloyl-ACP methyl ester carboxylesterase